MTAYEALIQRGIKQSKIQAIVKGYEAGASIELLSIQTDLSEEEVKKIIKEHASKRN